MASVTEPADQQNVQQHILVNGVHTVLSAAILKATAGNANVFKFSQSYTFYWNGQLSTYKQGCTYAMDAALKAALLAASAPMVQL